MARGSEEKGCESQDGEQKREEKSPRLGSLHLFAIKRVTGSLGIPKWEPCGQGRARQIQPPSRGCAGCILAGRGMAEVPWYSNGASSSHPSPEAVSKALNIINHEHKLVGAWGHVNFGNIVLK